MKKIFLLITLCCFMGALSSCHQQRARTIHIENDSMSLTIKYIGKIRFNKEGTGIQSISPNGSVSYKKDDKKLYADNDEHGKIQYEVHDGSLNMEQEEVRNKFIVSAVQEMIRVNAESRR